MAGRGPSSKKQTATWTEGPPDRWTNKAGYTLTRIASTKGWRLCHPSGEFLVTQLELFEGMGVVMDWADQYITYLEGPVKKKTRAKKTH